MIRRCRLFRGEQLRRPAPSPTGWIDLPSPLIVFVTTRARALLVLLLALACAGCGPFVDPATVQNRADTAAGPLGGENAVQERFTPSCNGLTSLEVQIAEYPDVTSRDGKLALTLDRLPAGSAPRIAVQEFDEAGLSGNGWIRLDFGSILDSRDHQYVLAATSTGRPTAAFTLWASSHVEPPGVQRFENGSPRPGALTMHQLCDAAPLDIASDTIARIARDRWLWPVELALCLVPGLGFARWTARRERDIAALLGYAAGWSVLLAPLALTIATPSALGEVVGPVVLVGGLVAIATAIRRDGKAGEKVVTPSPFEIRFSGASLVALAGTLGAVAVRTALARDLVLPMWVDSVQHSYIAQLIVDSGKVPATYGSAMPTEPFDYHFAFHALAAFGASIAGSSAAASVLATGQVLGCLIPLAVYALGRDLTGSPRAAAVASLLVAVVTTQPTYYVTWGRYPELAGLVALPAAYAALRAATGKMASRWSFVPAIAACAAMPLVHPRVAVFLAALVVGQLIATVRLGPRLLFRQTGRLAAIAVASGIVISPWILRQWLAHHDRMALPATFGPIDFPFGFAMAGNDRWVLGLALVGLGLASISQVDLVVTSVVWAALVVVAANPSTFGLPIYLWVNNDSVAIAMFLPATILAGYAVVQMANLVRYDRWPASIRNLAGLTVVVVAFSQLPSLLTVVNPCCYLGGSADLRAMDWIQSHTPPTARFVVNEYRWFGSVWAGSDAGFWLPVLARRSTTMPAMFYALGPRSDVQVVDDTGADIEASGAKPPELAAVARRVNAGYVFVGTQGGPIDPFALTNDPNFRVAYREGGAWVFEVVGVGGTARTTATGRTPAEMGRPSDAKAAGLRSTTSG